MDEDTNMLDDLAVLAGLVKDLSGAYASLPPWADGARKDVSESIHAATQIINHELASLAKDYEPEGKALELVTGDADAAADQPE